MPNYRVSSLAPSITYKITISSFNTSINPAAKAYSQLNGCVSPLISSRKQSNIRSRQSRAMSHFITTHNTSNESIFSTSSTEKRPLQDISGATIETVYTFHQFPPDVSTEDDIKQYEHDCKHGLSESKFSSIIATFPPGAETPMHRTMSVNVGIVLEGTMELHLDSGEVRTLNKGDSYTQRATMHKWKNVGEGSVRLATFSMPVVEPFHLNGRNLGSGRQS